MLYYVKENLTILRKYKGVHAPGINYTSMYPSTFPLLYQIQRICSNLHTVRVYDCSWPFGSVVCILGLWSDSSDLHASADVADQCLGYVTTFCWRILATHPTFLSLLAENSPHPPILQCTPVYVLANYAAWRPQRTIENAKWFSKKHTQYWTVSLPSRLHLTWEQLGWRPFQSVLAL